MMLNAFCKAKRDKRCGCDQRVNAIGGEYCDYHQYCNNFTDEQKDLVNTGKAERCKDCTKWHFNKNVNTNVYNSICFDCLKRCEWYNDVPMSQNKNRKDRLVGVDKFIKCNVFTKGKTLCCKDHDYAKDYNDDDKKIVSNCKRCNYVKILNDTFHCDKCSDFLKMVEAKHKEKEINLSTNNCIATPYGTQCRNSKKEGEYCDSHKFIPSKTIDNIAEGKKMCEKYGKDYDILDKYIYCSNCGISFLHGSSITSNKALSNKCPCCILHLRKKETERDRGDRRVYHNKYDKSKPGKERKIRFRENNPEKIYEYYTNYRAKKMADNIDEYRKHNAEVARAWRAKNPEYQQKANSIQKINIPYKYGCYKTSANDKGRVFELTYELCEQFFLDDCFYCGCKVDKDKFLHGIDRCDNNIGYTIDNCVPCCVMCNMMKGSIFNVESFILASSNILINLGIIEDEKTNIVFNYKQPKSFNGYKKSAESRNHNFLLTKEQFYSIIVNDCYLCGKQADGNYNGIDRVNNTDDYIIENCKACCGVCNFLKKNYNVSPFLEKMLRIYKFHCKNDKNITDDEIAKICQIATKLYFDRYDNINNNYSDVNNLLDNNDDNYSDAMMYENVYSHIYNDNETNRMNEYNALVLNAIDNDTLNQNLDTCLIGIINTINDDIDKNDTKQEIKKDTKKTIIIDNISSVGNNVTSNKKRAIVRKKEQKIIDQPSKDAKLIYNHTNPEYMKEKAKSNLLKKTERNLPKKTEKSKVGFTIEKIIDDFENEDSVHNNKITYDTHMINKKNGVKNLLDNKK